MSNKNLPVLTLIPWHDTCSWRHSWSDQLRASVVQFSQQAIHITTSCFCFLQLMKNFEGDCSPPSRGNSSFQRRQSYTICITDCWSVFFFLVLSLQPKWQHKGHLLYSQICRSTQLYLLGTVSSPIDPQHFLADLAHSIFGTAMEQLRSNYGAWVKNIQKT